MSTIRRAAFVLALVLGSVGIPSATAAAHHTTRPIHKAWSSIGFSNHNTAHDPTERTLTSASVHTLRPVVHRSIPRMGGPLIIDHGRLFDTCGGHGSHVWICAWSTSTLRQLWRARFVGSGDETDLAAAGHTLVVHAEGTTRYLALRQSSGARRWRISDPDPTLTIGLPPALATAKSLDYVDNHGRVVRRSMRTGKQLSRVAPNQLRPSAANNALLWELAGDIVTHHTVYRAISDERIAAAPLTCGHRYICPPIWTAHAGLYVHLIYADRRVFAAYSKSPTAFPEIGAFSARTGRREFTLRSNMAGWLEEGETEYLGSARDLIFFSDESGYVRAWKATGCGHRVCQPIWRSQPVLGQIDTPRFVETSGRLFTDGGYVYTTANVRHSHYGPPAAPKHIKFDFDPRVCAASLTWHAPAHTGRLPLTGSTVALGGGRVSYGSPTTGGFNGLPAGTYHAKIAVHNAWGHGPTASKTFTVPACSS